MVECSLEPFDNPSWHAAVGGIIRRASTNRTDVREFALQWQRECALWLREQLAGYLGKETPELKGTRTRDENRAPRRAVLKTAGNEEI